MGKKLVDQGPVWICSPLQVLARTRDSISDSWGILLQWKDLDEVRLTSGQCLHR